MILAPASFERTCTEAELIDELHRLDGCFVIELGCGTAALTGHLAGGPGRRVLALDVDEVQHRRNLARDDLPGVEFALGPAEAIPAGDACADAVFMFKSLHHVPVGHLDRALGEISRVLVPGGVVHISEPIAAGPYDELLALFHDERAVRAAAFAAVRRAVDAGAFELVGQTFYLAPRHFADFAGFECTIIQATHTHHELSPELHAEVRERFRSHCGADGARFLQPMRVDLLRKPLRPGARPPSP